MQLVFATNNQHKIEEINSILGDRYDIITLKQAGINIDIPEPHDTLEENAQEKASAIYRITNMNCFAEDTGLEVEALNGEPGVRSARYAGEEKSFKNNIKKLLHNLQGKENRNAQFRAVISLIIDGKPHQFEGISKGTIIADERGTGGFGYDPVFVPLGAEKTFAEMDMDEKNIYSHRRKAVDKLVAFLEAQPKQ